MALLTQGKQAALPSILIEPATNGGFMVSMRDPGPTTGLLTPVWGAFTNASDMLDALSVFLMPVDQ